MIKDIAVISYECKLKKKYVILKTIQDSDSDATFILDKTRQSTLYVDISTFDNSCSSSEYQSGFNFDIFVILSGG